MRLSFKKEYVAPILAGTKRQTIRARRPPCAVGDLVDATNQWGRPPFASLRVTSVEPVDLEDLTEHDALADGFADVAALRDVIEKTYPGVTQLWAIGFSLDSGRTRTSE